MPPCRHPPAGAGGLLSPPHTPHPPPPPTHPQHHQQSTRLGSCWPLADGSGSDRVSPWTSTPPSKDNHVNWLLLGPCRWVWFNGGNALDLNTPIQLTLTAQGGETVRASLPGMDSQSVGAQFSGAATSAAPAARWGVPPLAAGRLGAAWRFTLPAAAALPWELFREVGCCCCRRPTRQSYLCNGQRHATQASLAAALPAADPPPVPLPALLSPAPDPDPDPDPALAAPTWPPTLSSAARSSAAGASATRPGCWPATTAPPHAGAVAPAPPQQPLLGAEPLESGPVSPNPNCGPHRTGCVRGPAPDFMGNTTSRSCSLAPLWLIIVHCKCVPM